MSFWIVLTLLTAVASAALTVPLVRRHEARRAELDALSALKDQLAEIDAQAKDAVLGDAEAEALRLEVKRRMLAENTDIREARPLGGNARLYIALGTAAFIGVGSTLLYEKLGSPGIVTDAPAAAQAQQVAATDQPSPEVDAMVRQLEQRMAAEPNDPEGWRMLGWSYFQMRRFADSADAYRKAVALNPNDAGYVSALGEALVQNAQGQVTPEAGSAFEAAQRLDATDARARYFLSLRQQQRGDAEGAISGWLDLLKDAPADAPWAAQVRQAIEGTASDAGIDVSKRLAAISSGSAAATLATPAGAPAGAIPGPTAADVAAAQRMAPADQQAMIRGMVDGLAARLAQNPKDEAGWVRLMRARMVLNDRPAATAALRSAKAAFAGDAAALSRLDAAARELQVPAN
jgi:cytochrome c-type biogenesis protein CcmH